MLASCRCPSDSDFASSSSIPLVWCSHKWCLETNRVELHQMVNGAKHRPRWVWSKTALLCIYMLESNHRQWEAVKSSSNTLIMFKHMPPTLIQHSVCKEIDHEQRLWRMCCCFLVLFFIYIYIRTPISLWPLKEFCSMILITTRSNLDSCVSL